MTDTTSAAPSDAEIIALADETRTGEPGRDGYILPISFARAVLAKWATPPAVVGEPVAWLDPWTGAKVTTDYDAYGKHGIPLYTAPQPAPPADSVTAPASGATGKNLLQVQAWVIPDGNGGGQFSWQKQDERYWTRLTPPAQTADSVLEDAARYRWLAAHCRSTTEHWGGRWSIVVEGPAPKSHDSEDDFDAAIDAAMNKGGA